MTAWQAIAVVWLGSSFVTMIAVLVTHHRMTAPPPPPVELPRATAKEHRRDERVRRGR